MNDLKEISTEGRIKEAARAVFTAKGFAATRTRDIAEKSGTNLALINYYFGSKEALFSIIMRENILQFLSVIGKAIQNDQLSLIEKVEQVVEQYINQFKAIPELPFFMMNEVRSRPDDFIQQMGFKSMLLQSHFMQQLQEKAGRKINPIHFLLNILSLIAFPFIAAPMIKIINGIPDAEYLELMEERKKLIPFWIENLINADYSPLN